MPSSPSALAKHGGEHADEEIQAILHQNLEALDQEIPVE
jgi:hypothetical protein